jgi:hypothetical protein
MESHGDELSGENGSLIELTVYKIIYFLKAYTVGETPPRPKIILINKIFTGYLHNKGKKLRKILNP